MNRDQDVALRCCLEDVMSLIATGEVPGPAEQEEGATAIVQYSIITSPLTANLGCRIRILIILLLQYQTTSQSILLETVLLITPSQFRNLQSWERYIW